LAASNARSVSSVRFVESTGGWLGTFTAMASDCEVHVGVSDRRTAASVFDVVAAETLRIEAKFSRYRTDNVVHAINTAGGASVSVDEETASFLDYAAHLHEVSDGKFDVTSGVLRRIWKFDGSDRLPTPEQVASTLQLVGWQRVRWERPVLTLEPDMEIDFGGIGKEYAVDRAAALVVPIAEHCLLNFGGDLRALGPRQDRRPWQVGIEAVERFSTAREIVELYRGGLATSGDSRRFLLKEGRRYGHILDPTTGAPVVGAPRSVTVAANTCTEAGMLATLAMLRGPTAEAFLEEQRVRYRCYR
jgi:thiamine biosynthesis lipoprotein